MPGVLAVPVIPPRPEDIALTLRIQPEALDKAEFIVQLESDSNYSRNDVLKMLIDFAQQAYFEEKAASVKDIDKRLDAFLREKEAQRDRERKQKSR